MLCCITTKHSGQHTFQTGDTHSMWNFTKVFRPCYRYALHIWLSDIICRAVATVSGLEIVGAGAQFVAAGLGDATALIAAATFAGLVYPKK